MNKITNTRPAIRRRLLSTASAFALLASAYGAGQAEAADDDADRPLIWIELGGQIEHIGGQGAPFLPGFLAANPTSPVLQHTSPVQAQTPPMSFGEEVKLSYQPENSDWIVSASVRIGRSSNFRHIDHQTHGTWYQWVKYTGKPLHIPQFPSFNYHPLSWEKFAKTDAGHKESHAIVDFSVGKDVGLGMFGTGSSSVLSAGVRIAQFTTKQSVDMRARPDLNIYQYSRVPQLQAIDQFASFHTYHATGYADRDFHGIGPALSWSGSAPFVGNSQGGEITFDWSANAALLFGKQRTRVRDMETGWSKAHAGDDNQTVPYVTLYQRPGGHSNDRSVTVPNLGASAGLSYRYTNAKISFGYRADVFFGAMDTGIDAVKKSNLTFNGPYASISVGLGD